MTEIGLLEHVILNVGLKDALKQLLGIHSDNLNSSNI